MTITLRTITGDRVSLESIKKGYAARKANYAGRTYPIDHKIDYLAYNWYLTHKQATNLLHILD
jgi:hypothetical protein